ncbi:MAG: DUF721 domain-containing protein [Pseudomonadota bacterium]
MSKTAATIDTRPQRAAPPAIARAVDKISRRLAAKTGRVAGFVMEDWPAIVGPELADHCRPAALKGSGPRRTLYIDAYSGPAASRIQFMSEVILSRLRERLGPKGPRVLRIRQAARPIGPAAKGDVPATRETGRPAGRPEIELGDALQRLRSAFGAGSETD